MRANVVFPACRGPMIVTTGNSFAVAVNSLAICRTITVLVPVCVDVTQGQNKKIGTYFKLNLRFVPISGL